ncbi:MAG: hypothetical protein C3F12_13345 [Candidatus Methylomirabilota bacterium]|nr:hypothetical protein [candidate division NC10 bacterium]PWB42894.1 MAG: hypothetical protein C3F12_13345 [candidate division NC10 bacterium]
MPPKGRAAAKKGQNSKDPQAYDHKKGKEQLLLRLDVGLQAQFRQKKPPAHYRYNPSFDPSLSWDVSADRERAEAIRSAIEELTGVDVRNGERG